MTRTLKLGVNIDHVATVRQARLASQPSPLEAAQHCIAAGADGIIVEVHNNPSCALCDGAQSLTPAQFTELMEDVKKRAAFEGKKME